MEIYKYTFDKFLNKKKEFVPFEELKEMYAEKCNEILDYQCKEILLREFIKNEIQKLKGKYDDYSSYTRCAFSSTLNKMEELEQKNKED